MDLMSFLLCLWLTGTLVQACIVLGRGSNPCARKLPPGPVPLPVIGNLLKLGNKPHISLAKLAKIYGPIMTLKLGFKTTVVISSPAMAREVLHKHDLDFSNRAVPDSVRAHDHDKFSIGWLPISERWRTLRKISNIHIFSHKKLDANQHLRHQKVQELIAGLAESCKAGVAVDIGRVAFATTLNLLSNTIFSMDLAAPNSDTARELKELVRKIAEDAGKPNVVDYFPVLRKMDPQGIRRRMTVSMGKIIDLLDHMINQRLESMKVHGFIPSKDVLDTILSIDQNDGIDRSHTEHLLLDLLAAGTETTATTVEWAMAELLSNPKNLQKAKAEVEKTVGKGKPVEESDIAQLPYLQAIVKETFRLHPPGPFLVPREPEEDVEVCGFTVPKGASVIVNIWAIGRDPSIWLNPNLFMPERFIGEQLDVRGQDFELISFGAGRRMCPGLPLAMRMVHLMLGSLINSFDWKLEDGIAPEGTNMEEKFGLALTRAQPLRAVPTHV